jgi:hypothetical protein
LINKIRDEQSQGAANVGDIRVHKEGDWQEEEFKEVASTRIYIKEYRSSPIELEVSLINRVSLEQEEESGILKTISSLGLLISSIDEAPI